MVWPVSDVNTGNADAGTDNPATFRADVLDLIQKFNQLRNHVSTNMQGVLAASGLVESGGNYGVGVTPEDRLDLGNGNLRFKAALGGTGTYGIIRAYNTSAPTNPATAIRFIRDVAVFGNDGAICFDTLNAERARIDSAGNHGLGVVPSAWGNGVSMQGAAWALSTGTGFDNTIISTNARQTAYGGATANWVYRGTAPAGLYSQGVTHAWFSAASGTAGNPITFTQVMSVDVSGNWSVPGTATAASFSGAGTNLTGTANSLNAGIGVNQTWQNLTASRAIGTPYTNSTGKAIDIVISVNSSGNNTLTIVVGGVNVINCPVTASSAIQSYGPITVPNGATYQVNLTAATNLYWAELR